MNTNTDFVWNEADLALESDERFVRVVSKEEATAIDDALGLETIELRLPKVLIHQYQKIALENGLVLSAVLRTVLTTGLNHE